MACPFCGNNDTKKLYEIESPLNRKNYTLNHCTKCDLQFFTPLVFEDIYQTEEYSGYHTFHKGNRETPIWLIKTAKTIKELNIYKKGNKILDLDCGDCLLYTELQKELELPLNDYSGIDLDAKSIATCKRRGLHNVKKGYADKPIKFNKKFDIIIATEVLEHQTNPKKFLDNAFSLLKKGGYFIMSMPYRNRLFKNIRRDDPPHHFLLFNKEFFRRNYQKQLVLAESYDYNKGKTLISGAQFASEKMFKTKLLFIFFILPIAAIRILDHFIGEGMIAVLKK